MTIGTCLSIRLRPTLGAAVYLETKYGFQKLFDAVGSGNLTVIADVVEASSDCEEEFLKAIAGVPLIKVMPNVIEATTKQILALAGVDQDQTDSAEPQSGETMPFSAYHKRLFQIGTGWLGWPPETVWNATPREILDAYSGHIERLTAIHGSGEAEPEQRTAPDTAPLDRAGLNKLKSMTKAR